ncbi:MAG: UDP-N-acetylmuramoyl-L-alanyl-D-glutamate--2,6-diaminopimelate ligase [Candidatus Krumholzibacteriia bacterium]
MTSAQRERRGSVQLADLIAALKQRRVQKVRDSNVHGVTSDSRTVEAGDVFVAVRGGGLDGHNFVAEAAGKGAVALVTEEPVNVRGPVNIVVPDSTRALGELASRFFGDPAGKLRMFGVTGTNGKTSTAHMFRAICEHSRALGGMGIVGTVGHGTGSTLEASVHTTPEPVTLHRLLRQMVDSGCNGVVMEVSSHAVRQQRIWGLDFEIGMLTNVTRDHLDYHSSFEDYADAKREFCLSLVSEHRSGEPGTLVYSRDNEITRGIGQDFPGQKVATSIVGKGDVYADNVEATLEGTRFDLHLGGDAVAVSMKLLGSFTAANATLAAAAAYTLGIEGATIRDGLESVQRVPGRFDALGGSGKPVVVVDYSHTPDSLERTLQFCRGLQPRRLIVVFGCGGDRDRGKRPLMGGIAQENCDVCYVTSDNPRTEDPRRIIDEILSGMDTGKKGTTVEVDRRKAIRAAIESSGPRDLVAVCGKGHEDYQIIGTARYHFDDREEASKALHVWSGR